MLWLQVDRNVIVEVRLGEPQAFHQQREEDRGLDEPGLAGPRPGRVSPADTDRAAMCGSARNCSRSSLESAIQPG